MVSAIPESSRRSFLYRLGFAGAAPALLSAYGTSPAPFSRRRPG